MEKVVGIEHISNEILSLVFHFLDWKSFVRANAVCKAWRHFHKEDYLWKHMYLRDFIEFTDNGPLPNLPFATLYQKSILYRNWKLIHTHKTFDEAWQVSFSPNGQYLASSDKAGALKIWQLNIRQEPSPSVAIEELFTRTYMESITRHEWSPNSNHLICTMSDDSAVGLNMKDWSDSLFVRVALFDCYAGWLNGDQMLHTLRYSDNGPGVKEMIMQLTDVATKKLIWKSYIHCSPTILHFNILSPKKTYVTGATASIGSADMDLLDELWLVEVEQLKKRAVPYKEENFDEDGIYYDDEDDETEKPKPEATTREHCKIIRETGHIIGFTFSEDEEQVLINIRPFTDPSNAAVVDDIETHLWDVKTLTKISSWTVGQCKDMFIVHPSFALSEQIICSGSGDGKLTFVHKHSENVSHQLKAHEKLLNFATVHPEVDLLVTASDSNEVKFWVPLHNNLDAKFVQ